MRYEKLPARRSRAGSGYRNGKEEDLKILNGIVYYGYLVFRKLGALILTVMFLSITAGIISRYFFNSPFSWTEELTTFMMVYLCYISAAITTADKKHIVADFLISAAPEKFRKVMNFVSRILMVIFFVVLCISVIKLIPTLRWVSGVLYISRKWYYYPILVTSVYMIFTVIVDMLNEFFPGHDLMAQARQKRIEREKEEERLEAEQIQKNMEDFVKSAQVHEEFVEGGNTDE